MSLSSEITRRKFLTVVAGAAALVALDAVTPSTLITGEPVVNDSDPKQGLVKPVTKDIPIVNDLDSSIVPLQEFSQIHPELKLDFIVEPGLPYALLGVNEAEGEKLIKMLGNNVHEKSYTITLKQPVRTDLAYVGLSGGRGERVDENGNKRLEIFANPPTSKDMEDKNFTYFEGNDVAGDIARHVTAHMFEKSFYDIPEVPNFLRIVVTSTE